MEYERQILSLLQNVSRVYKLFFKQPPLKQTEPLLGVWSLLSKFLLNSSANNVEKLNSFEIVLI